MSVICNKCGIQTRDGAKFCHGCGTPISTAALPPTMPIGTPSGDIPPKAAVPLAPEPPMGAGFSKATETMRAPQTSYIPQAPSPNYQQAIAKPKRSGNATKIILGIFLFIGLIIAGAIGGGIFLASKAIDKVNNTVKNAPIEGIPGGISIGDNLKVKVGTEALNEDDLQVPIYPNAKVTTPFNISGHTDSGESGGYATLETKDDYDAVVEWYLEEMGNDARRTKTENNEKKVTKYELNDERGFRSVEITGYYRNRKNTEIKIFSAMAAIEQKDIDAEAKNKDLLEQKAEPPPAAAPPTGKKKAGVPPPPPAPPSVDNLGEHIKDINKQVNEALVQSQQEADSKIEKAPIAPKLKKQIREQIRDAMRQERNSSTAPNQD